MPPAMPINVMPMYVVNPTVAHTPPKKVTKSTNRRITKQMIMPTSVTSSMVFEDCMQNPTYKMVYHKNAVVN